MRKPATKRAASADRSLSAADEARNQVAAILATQAVIEFELDGTIRWANDLFLKTMGYSLQDIQGRHHSLFVDETERSSPAYREFWARLGRGEPHQGDFRRVGKGGREVWIQATYTPISADGGHPYKVIKYATDVTALAVARAEAARISSMMEQAPINVMYADREFKIRYLNTASLATLKRLEPVLPVRADQLLGRSIDTFHKQPEYQRRLLSDPTKLPHRAVIRLADQSLDLLVSSIRDASGAHLGYMVTWEVVTERLAAEERERENTERMRNVVARVDESATSMAAAAEELTAVSAQLSGSAEAGAAQAGAVSAAAEQVSRSVQTVASAVEELGTSIREISKNASDGARIAREAVDAANRTNSTISKLGESSSEIGQVVKVITTIAQQTNLLALNATIEAARAGEAGKGFAVVANEVKELAKETAKATEDIGNRVVAIQADTAAAVTAIRGIATVIEQMSDLSNGIAGAVEEQSATANEMSRNVNEAARGAGEIAQNVVAVAQAAQETKEAASNVRTAAEEVARMASDLEQVVSGSASTQATQPPPAKPTTGTRTGSATRR